MRAQSRALSSDDVYHNKVKIPEGYVSLTEVTCLPVEITYFEREVYFVF